jgi:hypothetical protein
MEAMNPNNELLDPAAIFGCALSLWSKCMELADTNDQLDLSECYNGLDQLMREVMRIGEQFEAWACEHVAFDTLNDCWPYLLEERFGEACISTLSSERLSEFDAQDCLRVAMLLKLPIKHDGVLPLPVCVSATNPVAGSAFTELRIQSIRTHLEDEDKHIYGDGDEPFDSEFGEVFYSLYGVESDGKLAIISDFKTYLGAVELASKLAPGISFPRVLIFKPKHSFIP